MYRVVSKNVVAAPMLAAILLALMSAMMGIWIRMMGSSFGTWQQVYLRILLAGIIAASVFRKSLTRAFIRQVSKRDWFVYIIRAIFAYVFGVGFYTIAIEHAQLGMVSFISSLPILGILAWMFFRERVRFATWPYILFSVVGLIMLTGLNLVNFSLGWGELAALICLLGFDIGVLLSKYHPPSFSIYQNTTLLLLIGWIPLFVVSIASREPLLPVHVTINGWIGLAFSSVFNVAILILIHYVFSHLKAYVAGNLLLLEGIFALVIGFLVYGEIPTLTVIAGGAIILASGFMISLIDGRSEWNEPVG